MTMPDQAPQTLDELLHIARVNWQTSPDEMFDKGVEVATKQALTALIERVIGEDEPKLVNGVRHPLPHHSHRNQLRAEQRKRLGELL